VTREEAIEILTNLQNGHGVSYSEDYGLCFGHKWMQAYEMAIAALREQPRWISVEERLPDGNAKCLVSIHYRDGYDTIDVLWFRKAYKSLDLPKKGDYWLRYDSEYGDIDMTALVTHWMPLPELPEVEV
jgi:hypothetical protein